MKHIGLAWIIHLFAALHAAVVFLCRSNGVDDELLLTVLTMVLAIIICRKKGLTIEFTAAIIIVVNILGYLLGNIGANLLRTFMTTGYAANALSTAATTEILGWSIVAMTKFFRKDTHTGGGDVMSPTFRWTLFVASGIFFLRIVIVLLFSHNSFDSAGIYGMMRKVLSNSVAITILICLNILFVRLTTNRRHKVKGWRKHLHFGMFMLMAALLETVLVGLGLPFHINKAFLHDFPLLLVVSLITQITVYCIVYMSNYAITARNEMHHAREKANMAQYRYLKLKRQVNPHFLFNSLNILDCLICEGKPEKASLYTHKLAGIYRYMIKSEEEEIVPLRDEISFAELYIDLLEIRFPEGFKVIIDVPEELMSQFVPPCSIQLLIENATKHNAVDASDPLVIKVEGRDGNIIVSNNIIPKMTKAASTGLGQQYIRQLYMDISGKSIDIHKTDNEYRVILPLL